MDPGVHEIIVEVLSLLGVVTVIVDETVDALAL